MAFKVWGLKDFILLLHFFGMEKVRDLQNLGAAILIQNDVGSSILFKTTNDSDIGVCVC